MGEQAGAIPSETKGERALGELGAVFRCANLGSDAHAAPDHAVHLNAWLNVLKVDTRAIFTAASKAPRAADYLTGF